MAYGPLPDQGDWTGVDGRNWIVEGNGLVLWISPTIQIVGNDPQRMGEGSVYEEQGATAEDCNGLDLTSSIVIDSSAVDPDTPGSYIVTYDVTDSQGATAGTTREVRVIDINQPSIRAATVLLLDDSLPDGVQVYATPAEQVKAPAVVVGTTSWVPVTQNALRAVQWSVVLKLMVVRSVPEFNVNTLETLSIKAAQVLAVGGYRVVGFETTDTETIGGTEYLTGSLEVEYRSETN